MSIAIINLYEVYNPHAVLLSELLRSRLPNIPISILNTIGHKQSYTHCFIITSDEFLYFFQNLRDEYNLSGMVFINVRNLYPGMISYKYKSFRHIFNTICQAKPISDIKYNIIKSEHHYTFFKDVSDYKLFDWERDILPLFPVNKPIKEYFELAEYTGLWIIGDEKRAQKTVGSVFSSFIPVEYITYNNYLSRLTDDAKRKRIAVVYFENTGIPDFFTIYQLISSSIYKSGLVDLLTITDEYRPEYLEMYNKWDNNGKDILLSELEVYAKEAFKYIQFIKPPQIKYNDLLDLLLDDENRLHIVKKYGRMRRYTFTDYIRDADEYFGKDNCMGVFDKLLIQLSKLAPKKQRDLIHLSNYSVKPFYEVPYSLRGEGVSLHLPPLEESQMERVSVVTPTRYRGMLLMNIVWSLNNSIYPHRLIEWVILDNGDKEAEASMPDKCRMDLWLPRIRETLNPSIKLSYHTEEADRYSLGELRNRAVEKATAPIIVFMDDDDYYPPESIIARVKALHIRPDLRLVGCVRIVNYNVETNRWNMTGLEKYLSEASLAFRRRFWEVRPFARQKCNEIALFIYGREEECCHILSQFVIFSVYHRANFTGDLRLIKNDSHKQDLDIELPDEVINRFKEWIK